MGLLRPVAAADGDLVPDGDAAQEHRRTRLRRRIGPDPFRAARTTRAAWWERAFIAPYWVNFHAEHHLFMHVPCWKLPRLHRALRDRPQAQGMEVSPGYLDVIRTATRRPA